MTLKSLYATDLANRLGSALFVVLVGQVILRIEDRERAIVVHAHASSTETALGKVAISCHIIARVKAGCDRDGFG
jgi:hypothetical protein